MDILKSTPHKLSPHTATSCIRCDPCPPHAERQGKALLRLHKYDSRHTTFIARLWTHAFERQGPRANCLPACQSQAQHRQAAAALHTASCWHSAVQEHQLVCMLCRGSLSSHVHAHLVLDELLLSSTDNGQVGCHMQLDCGDKGLFTLPGHLLCDHATAARAWASSRHLTGMS